MSRFQPRHHEAHRYQRMLARAAAIAVFASTVDSLADDELISHVRRSDHRLPEGRVGFATALDSKRHLVIMVGGRTSSKDQAPATLALDLRTMQCTELTGRGEGPANTFMANAAYDPKTDTAYVFGGWPRGADAPSADLWMLSLSDRNRQWRRLSDGSTGPRGRNGAAMLLDPGRRRLILFGGDGGPNPTIDYTPLNDLWEYDLQNSEWTQLRAKGDIPDAR